MSRSVLARVVFASVLVVSACSGGGDAEPVVETITTVTTLEPVDETNPATTVVESVATTDSPTTVVEPIPDTSTTAAPSASNEDLERIVAALASDELMGRNNATRESIGAQNLIIAELSEFAVPLSGDATDAEAFRIPAGGGTNVMGLIPGTDRADEYVIVGAHYDHLGDDAETCEAIEADVVCNGATDNATGVAEALALGRALATRDEAPRRTVVFAFWDVEEDGLAGSSAYVADPAFPLAQTIAYVNFDIQGARLSPALADFTVIVGAETGGPNLVAAAERATAASSLDSAMFSLLFGQGRSDHAPFAAAGVPVVFFTDANGPCYHTAGDDVDIVDFDKLGQQLAASTSLVAELVATDDVPAFDAAAPPASFADAETMLGVLQKFAPDRDRYPADVVSFYDGFLTDLTAVVDAGEAEFGEDDVATLLGGSVRLVEALTTGDCDGFLDG